MTDKPIEGIEREQARLEQEIANLSAQPRADRARVQRLKTLKLAVDAEVEYRRGRRAEG
jgi:hypothetical protein